MIFRGYPPPSSPAQTNLPSGISIAPLTESLVHLDASALRTFNRTGDLVTLDAANSLTLSSGDIPLISCDESAYPGNLDASETVAKVITSQQKPSAVLLYTSEAHHCNYSANEASTDNYTYVFTLLNTNNSASIKTLLDSSTTSGTTTIVANMSFNMGSIPPTTDEGKGSANSPNTAMIILYSITGIITALFLAIIITGAVRAHRHPERYGPRYTAGRPRQSRARGIARAMLETIPIVKFGDDHDPKADAVKRDVEMSLEGEDGTGHDPDGQEREMTGADNTRAQETRTQPTSTPSPAADTNPEQRTGADAGTAQDHPNFSCPICTDDFVKGQDLRVLPCNHKFHPECIDPWLVNVSGTCPLCRIDLNPPKEEGEEQDHEEGERPGPSESPREGSPEPTAEPTHRHRRLSSYLHSSLNARRMRDASVEERIAALRSVREETNQDGTNEDTDERLHRRSRLTHRLRDRFRIHTRPHREESGS
ncbi:hypothetical protein FE257_011213 [Aspergillus nanangensis]|uniref:RING-type domain-containing protein n=1 Tax=Aspergillus nanangensis TaxID=2582783 RepID=A0AAD4CHQ0_ASPNN|nr:hypothetical protein FE257_011213 [Aspergillus nanangensis]